ncbi:hypothetical protein OH76DRAFT_1091591 [Lentinus brumalis]|uniref:Uncharacterized protein n=1 Tax=Lentinus brumalis TaxID=2498619 RepID=A0A371CWD7_9APHY|nr:hypothetical protein OH76DRAFT_1091591 [Polyporus brumalis]
MRRPAGSVPPQNSWCVPYIASAFHAATVAIPIAIASRLLSYISTKAQQVILYRCNHGARAMSAATACRRSCSIEDPGCGTSRHLRPLRHPSCLISLLTTGLRASMDVSYFPRG